MEQEVFQERVQAHALLDMLPAEKLNAVRGLLEVMIEPVPMESLAQFLARVPVDDEDITPETAAALDRARDSLGREETVSHDEILREFGITG